MLPVDLYALICRTRLRYHRTDSASVLKHGKFPLFAKSCIVSFGINFIYALATLTTHSLQNLNTSDQMKKSPTRLQEVVYLVSNVMAVSCQLMYILQYIAQPYFTCVAALDKYITIL